MIRKTLATIAIAAVAVLTVQPAAWSAPQPGTPTPVAPHPRHSSVVSAPLCVTTTWRALHTHRPKTRPGQVCRLTSDMWLPRSWRVLGPLGSTLLVQRPPFVAHRSVWIS